MRRTVPTTTAALLLAAALAGCGGSSTDEPSVSASSGGTTAASSGPSDAASSGSSGSNTSVKYTDAEACAWLKKAIADTKDITTEVGVMAQLTIGLASFFEDHGGLENADGPAFDAATTRGCKALHDKAIKRAGISSFGSL